MWKCRGQTDRGRHARNVSPVWPPVKELLELNHAEAMAGDAEAELTELVVP